MRHVMKVMMGPASLLICATPVLLAQASAPTAYTLTQVSRLTEASMFSGQASTLKVYRSGSRELVELTIPPWPANPQGVRSRTLFDFDAHRAYTQDLVNNVCSWITYVSTRAPIGYDPITAMDDAARAEMAKAGLRSVGKEVVSGVPAVIYEADSPNGKARTWIAQDGGFLVKMTLDVKGGTPTTLLEVKQVVFNAAAASLFAAPANCSTQAQGEWSDTGLSARAGVQVDAQASASTDIATGKTQAQVSAEMNQAAPSPGSTTAVDSRVDGLVYTNDLEPSAKTCTVLFRVVRVGTMKPIVSGLEVLMDNRNVTAQYRNGVLRISNAPPSFDLQVNVKDGAGYGNSFTRQCYRPETSLLLAVPLDPMGDQSWYWAKSGKYATVPK